MGLLLVQMEQITVITITLIVMLHGVGKFGGAPTATNSDDSNVPTAGSVIM